MGAALRVVRVLKYRGEGTRTPLPGGAPPPYTEVNVKCLVCLVLVMCPPLKNPTFTVFYPSSRIVCFISFLYLVSGNQAPFSTYTRFTEVKGRPPFQILVQT